MKPSFWKVFGLIAILLLAENFVILIFYYAAHVYSNNAAVPVLLYSNQIDVVYTWCNGSDPTYLLQRKRASEKMKFNNDTVNRFRYHEELKYSLRSVNTFAPWVRNVFIVTDEVPSFLNLTNPKVKLVPLKEIFTNPNNLPTFNSQAIEAQLHHIPGLSEKFIYMNDDFFFGQPTTPATFLDGELRHKVMLNLGRKIPAGQDHPQAHSAAAQRANVILDGLFGQKLRYDHAHAPQLFDKSLLSMLEQMDILAPMWNATTSHPFRDRQDLQVQYLTLHFMLETRQAKPIWAEAKKHCHKAKTVAYCGIEIDKKYNFKTFKMLEKNKPLFFSMNDQIEEGEWDEEVEVALHEFFERTFPQKAPFEI